MLYTRFKLTVVVHCFASGEAQEGATPPRQVHQMAVSLFRLIGSIGRSMVVTNTLGSFSLLVVFVLGGFIIAKRDIHPWCAVTSRVSGLCPICV